jgi:hypothetical protein
VEGGAETLFFASFADGTTHRDSLLNSLSHAETSWPTRPEEVQKAWGSGCRWRAFQEADLETRRFLWPFLVPRREKPHKMRQKSTFPQEIWYKMAVVAAQIPFSFEEG